MLLPHAIPFAHCLRRTRVGQIEHAVEGLPAELAGHLQRLRYRFDAVADGATQRGAENDVAERGADRVIDDLRSLSRYARGDDRQQESFDCRFDAVIPVGHHLRLSREVTSRPSSGEPGTNADHQVEEEQPYCDP